MELSEASNQRLRKALALLDVDNNGQFDAAELVEVLRSAEDIELTDTELDDLLYDSKAGAEGGGSGKLLQVAALGGVCPSTPKRRTELTFNELKKVLVSGKYRQQESGRRYVLLSLAEAETIRCILHLRRGKEPVEGCDTAMALRCVCANDVILDASANYKPGTRYQGSVAHNSFRFFNSDTHYKPGDINVLLREIPEQPIRRRLFFTATVACRRRLAKRWEQTPLAKLFTLEDQWSLLKQRAQAVRMREAIRARGLLLHDAFQKFDWDRNGFLSMGEMYGALEWLQLPGLTPQDVIFFMKNAGAETTQLSYNDFIALLLPESGGEECADAMMLEDAQGPAPEDARASQPARPKLKREESRVAPKYEDELRELLAEQVSLQRKEEEALEKLEARQASVAQELLQSENADSFGWMKSFHCSETKLTNPHTTRSAVMYDFSKGVKGSRTGAPLWIEGRGKWQLVLEEGVNCYKGWEDNFLVLRVPFRKNGSGMHLNQYTVSMHVKIRNVEWDDDHVGLLASQGWDQFSKPKEGESCENALAYLTDSGGIGCLGSFGERSAVKDGVWHTVHIAVDTVGGTMKTFCDGEAVATVQSGKITKDGQFALRGRVALFFKLNESNPHNRHSVFYLRSATVHSRVLTPSMMASEHEMNRQLHILDAMQRAPEIHQAALKEQHARWPFDSVSSMVAALTKMHVDADDVAKELWNLIQSRDHGRLRTLLDQLRDQDPARSSTLWKYGATWKKFTAPQEQKNETVSPFGETLLHAAAFVGNLDVIALLLKHGANVNAKGMHSSCTPLHSAAAAGRVNICRALLAAGAKVNAASLSRKTALYVAATKGWYDVVRLLVKEGGCNPYSGGPSSADTPMALLRAVGSEECRRLVVELDAVCDARASTQAAAAGADSAGGEGAKEMAERSGNADSDSDDSDEEEDDSVAEKTDEGDDQGDSDSDESSAAPEVHSLWSLFFLLPGCVLTLQWLTSYTHYMPAHSTLYN
jgi:Ca2+-binding EF-hand superfamily protein